MLYPTLFL